MGDYGKNKTWYTIVRIDGTEADFIDGGASKTHDDHFQSAAESDHDDNNDNDNIATPKTLSEDMQIACSCPPNAHHASHTPNTALYLILHSKTLLRTKRRPSCLSS